MQALILAGGEGTRLRPLTSTVPKPVVPLVDRPFIAFMIEWLRGYEVDDIILACGFMADGVRSVLGDGSAMGVRLRYIEEPSPLGTGGALKYAEELLDERFFMLNGDILTDIDLDRPTAPARGDRRAGHARADRESTTRRRTGWSAATMTSRCAQFVEKPSPEEIDTNLVNAGAYILDRDVLDGMAPTGTKVSIERDVFPALVGNGLTATRPRATGWTSAPPSATCRPPSRSSRATSGPRSGRAVAEAGGVLRHGGDGAGIVHGPALVGSACELHESAHVGSRTVLGRRREGRLGRSHRQLGRARRRHHRRGHADHRVHRRSRRHHRRALPHRGPGGARARRERGLGKHSARRDAYLSGRGAPRRSHCVLSTTGSLSAEAIAAVDSSHQFGDVQGLPEHLRDALWRVESANLGPQDSPGGLVVAGMGGSAIGGMLAVAALGDRASRPIIVARDYGLPAWTTTDTTVLCVSYSGDTEETLAAYEAAGALGARRIVSTTGGALARSARADGVPVDPASRRVSAPGRRGLWPCGGAGGRGAGRLRRAAAH